jgi:hypothetical protein
MSIDPIAAPRVTAGVDWAKDDHAVCVVGDQGRQRVGRRELPVPEEQARRLTAFGRPVTGLPFPPVRSCGSVPARCGRSAS